MHRPRRRSLAQMMAVACLAAWVAGPPQAGLKGHAGQTSQPGQRSSGSMPAPSGGAIAEIVARPVSLRSGIGNAREQVTTRMADAQRFYDQGLSYLHGFVWIEAARSFNQALRADPELAMAQLGLSYALGELGEPAVARAASRRATELSAGVTPRERFRIELRARQLQAADRPQDGAAVSVYRTQLNRIEQEFGSDVELLLLAGHAQDGSADAHGMTGGSASRRFYERALVQAPDYSAIHHYLAHAFENTGDPKAALQHAQRFAALAPSIPHAHHMYGHSLRQVDRMREAIVEFETADKQHVAYATAEKIPLALDWHYRHNLDLLGTAYQFTGQMTRAADVLRRSFDMPAAGHLGHEQDVHKRAWPLFLLGRQRLDEAAAAAKTMQVHPSGLVQALGHIIAGRVSLTTGHLEQAAVEGNVALKLMRSLGRAGGTLVPDFELAQGEYLMRTGELAKGGAMVKAGVSKLKADRSPDAWIATVFQLEAAVHTARALGQPMLAAEIATLLREHAPSYAGTHYALGLLAEDRGDVATARTSLARAVEGWKDADATLRERSDARARLGARQPGAPPVPR